MNRIDPSCGERSAEAAVSLSGLDPQDIEDVLQAATRAAEALRGARILMTGATGWFGTWLLDAMVALDRSHSLGLKVVAVSRHPLEFRAKHPLLHAAEAIEWFEADVRDSLLEAPGPFTHIIHAATDSSSAETPDQTFETIVLGTLNVLKTATHSPGSRVLLVGSGAVYGPQPEGVGAMNEDHRGAPDVLDPNNGYAEGKRAAEQLGSIWHALHGVHVVVARCFAFVGPHMPFDAHFAIGNFIRDSLRAEPIRIGGDGTPRRTYLYMSDLVVWLLTILVDGTAMRPYNVGACEPVSIAGLAARCAALESADLPVEIVGRRGGRDYVPDVGRAREELGLVVRVSLDEAIRRTAHWKRRQDAARARPVAETTNPTTRFAAVLPRQSPAA